MVVAGDGQVVDVSFKGLETKRVHEGRGTNQSKTKEMSQILFSNEVFERLSNIKPCFFNTGALMS